MPNLSQMETFVLTAELGSLAAAGRKLGISAAAISKQLTRLEEELGLQLLLRTTRRIELTEVGTNYSLQCRRIATTRYVLCASPDYLKKFGTPKKPAEKALYFFKSSLLHRFYYR